MTPPTSIAAATSTPRPPSASSLRAKYKRENGAGLDIAGVDGDDQRCKVAMTTVATGTATTTATVTTTITAIDAKRHRDHGLIAGDRGMRCKAHAPGASG
jgi:hypothetical protein